MKGYSVRNPEAPYRVRVYKKGRNVSAVQQHKMFHFVLLFYDTEATLTSMEGPSGHL